MFFYKSDTSFEMYVQVNIDIHTHTHAHVRFVECSLYIRSQGIGVEETMWGKSAVFMKCRGSTPLFRVFGLEVPLSLSVGWCRQFIRHFQTENPDR